MINNFKTGIYVHFPFCKSKCGYCNFISGTDFHLAKDYIEELIKEIELRKTYEAVDSVYFGGGTPSALPVDMLTSVLEKIRESFLLSPNCEITVECNPESVSKEFIEFCKVNKVNRVSLGVQSTCDEVLKKSGRIHSYAQAENAVLALNKAGIKNINCDLILGLPSQTLLNALESINKLTDLPITHISMYGLKVEEGTPFFKNGYAVNEDDVADMYEACSKALTVKGFNRYEVSNFALGENISRHNYKYWLRKPYFGFGAAAHSFIDNKRIENTPFVKDYIQGKHVLAVEEISSFEALNETLMLGLRTAKGIDLSELKENFNYSLLDEKKEEIAFLVKHNLIKEENDCLKLTDEAFYVMNSVILKLLN